MLTPYEKDQTNPFMKELIAFCGLDCGRCDARRATLNNDDELRQHTARLWSELNNDPSITPELIHCLGCRTNGVKTVYCQEWCPIRRCATGQGVETCADCRRMSDCVPLGALLRHNAEARERLLSWETERLLLRPWREQDADALFRHASHPEVGPRAGWPPHQSREESLHIIRTVFHNDTTWALVLRTTDEPIGAIGYGPSCETGLPAHPGEPTVGYWVARPYWGQGFCTEALSSMLERCRRTTHIASFISGHFTDNPASGRVMEKCGFVATGETCSDPTLFQGKDRPIRVLRFFFRRDE